MTGQSGNLGVQVSFLLQAWTLGTCRIIHIGNLMRRERHGLEINWFPRRAMFFGLADTWLHEIPERLDYLQDIFRKLHM